MKGKQMIIRVLKIALGPGPRLQLSVIDIKLVFASDTFCVFLGKEKTYGNIHHYDEIMVRYFCLPTERSREEKDSRERSLL